MLWQLLFLGVLVRLHNRNGYQQLQCGGMYKMKTMSKNLSPNARIETLLLLVIQDNFIQDYQINSNCIQITKLVKWLFISNPDNIILPELVKPHYKYRSQLYKFDPDYNMTLSSSLQLCTSQKLLRASCKELSKQSTERKDLNKEITKTQWRLSCLL